MNVALKLTESLMALAISVVTGILLLSNSANAVANLFLFQDVLASSAFYLFATLTAISAWRKLRRLKSGIRILLTLPMALICGVVGASLVTLSALLISSQPQLFANWYMGAGTVALILCLMAGLRWSMSEASREAASPGA